MWETTPEKLGSTLFLYDGPLSIGGRYTMMVRPMRKFLIFAAEQGTPVYLSGVEKTGRFVNYLLAMQLPPAGNLSYAVPTHGYIQTEIDGRPLNAAHKYGERHLLGDRVLVRLPQGRQLVLSIPTIVDKAYQDRPLPEDLIGLEEILSVIPLLVTPIYDNALFPISRVNSLVSIAQKPCGHMLELFSERLLRK